MAQTDRIAGYVGDIALKLPCRVATTGAITLSGLQTIDGVVLAAGDRVLVKDQVSSVENGIYFVATGNWSRTPDFDGARDVAKGTSVLVTDGTTQANRWYIVTSVNPINPATDAVTFLEEVSGPSSAAAAAASATNAATSATNAATSATNAATSATNAATSASGAATSASGAATSETNAATSASNASTSETNAAASAANLPNAPTAGADKYIKSNATADGWVYKTPAEVTAEVAAGLGFAIGTRMLFQQSAAPVGWTKDATAALNDSALRIVTGAVASGGSLAFSAAFAAGRVVSGTTDGFAAGGTVNSGGNGTSGATTLSVAQMPSHTHPFTAALYATAHSGSGTSTPRAYNSALTTNATGGNGSHTHTTPAHSHSFTGTAHSHTLASSSLAMNVKYTDLIIATKD